MNWEKEANRVKGGSCLFFGDGKCVNQIQTKYSRNERQGKIQPKWFGKSLSTALSSVTCREVGWILRENGWLEGRYTAGGVRLGSCVGLIWNQDSKYEVLEPPLARLAPTLLFCFHLCLKTTAWKDLKQSYSPCMISHTENHVATSLCLSLLLNFYALMTYLGCSKNLFAYVEAKKGGWAEVRGVGWPFLCS